MSGRTGRLRIFFDGGCRPNPGTMEIAAVARGVTDAQRDIGRGDSQEAEWLALLHAVRIAIEIGAEDVELVGDSTAVIRQARGAAKCRDPEMRRHLAAYQAAVATIPRVRLRHVPRSKNLAGIALAKAHPR
ncbi:reverse transcriptase-like protein [Sphingomonas bacterium]|uniref:reverse transcriptase-like protein n=1 Tax=Sphingomonas bacterium TaxID=1895847 RepID=UPI0020C6CCAB|nr:reverse transcriptase-like protein [Sphingomonas bacterium]